MIYLACFLGWNAFVYLLYGLDKWKAKRGAWRIPEFWLISLAFLMGSLGAIFGMLHFNHKTKKMKFRLLVPLAFTANVGVALLIFHYLYIKNGWSIPSVISCPYHPSPRKHLVLLVAIWYNNHITKEEIICVKNSLPYS